MWINHERRNPRPRYTPRSRPQLPPASAPHPFDDVVRPYQQAAISWMAEEAITTGTTPTTFDPDGAMTRAEAATFLFRFMGRPAGAAEALSSNTPCDAPIRDVLQRHGLTVDEAACAAPLLVHFGIDPNIVFFVFFCFLFKVKINSFNSFISPSISILWFFSSLISPSSWLILFSFSSCFCFSFIAFSFVRRISSFSSFSTYFAFSSSRPFSS